MTFTRLGSGALLLVATAGVAFVSCGALLAQVPPDHHTTPCDVGGGGTCTYGGTEDACADDGTCPTQDGCSCLQNLRRTKCDCVK